MMKPPKNKIKAITPDEVEERIKTEFPDYIFEAVNNCIKRHYKKDTSFIILRNEILNEIVSLAPEGVGTKEIFKNKWLDFEPFYREQGWEVSYDSPCRDESFEERFTFKAKKKYNIISQK